MSQSKFNLSFDSYDGSTDDPDYAPSPAKSVASTTTRSSNGDVQNQDTGGEIINQAKSEVEEEKVDVTEVLKQKKTRIKMDNLDFPTEKYLEVNQPTNSKRSIKTATSAFENVLKELHEEETRKLEDIPDDTLAAYLEEFFKCVVKEDGSTYNASTLSTYYNSLSRFILEKKKINIKTNEKFSRVAKVLARRQEESCREGEIPGKNAPKPIPREVLVATISQGKIGYDDPKSLTANVIKSFQAGFGIRNRQEMYQIMNCDIEVGPLKTDGLPEYLELGERITKMRRGKRGQGMNFIYKIW